MSCRSIVGRAELDGLAFYYDRRTGLQIPEAVIASKYKSCPLDYVSSFTDIIQISRIRDTFNLVIGDQKGLVEISVEYNNTDKTFTCDKYDPRKIIPMILENEDTKLYFIARNHPYYDKSFVHNYGDDDIPVKHGIKEIPPNKQDMIIDKLYNFEKEGHRSEYEKFIEKYPKYDELKHDELKYEDIYYPGCQSQLQINKEGNTIQVTGGPQIHVGSGPQISDTIKEYISSRRTYHSPPVTPKKRHSTEPIEDERCESIWDSYYQKRIQEPDSNSDSGCDSDGCADAHRDKGIHSFEPSDRLTEEEIKEIDAMFGNHEDVDLDDKSTWSLSTKRMQLREVPIPEHDPGSLDEFDNDVPRRVLSHTTFGDLRMRQPLYKLPSQFSDATEEEKKIASARYRAAQVLNDMDLEKAIHESIKLYGSHYSGIDTIIRDASVVDDPIQPGLSSDSLIVVKPPKLEEREDNL